MDLAVPRGSTRHEYLGSSRHGSVIERIEEAADELYRAFHGDDNEAAGTAKGRAA